MKTLALAFLLCLGLTASAQETEIFMATQSGSPFDASIESDQFFWNYSFGVEQYMLDKLSVGISYRKTFDLVGGLTDRVFEKDDYASGNRYTYNEKLSSYAIDIESKYFFEETDDGWYLSSGLSYQHIQMDVTVITIDPSYNGGNPTPVPLPFTIGVIEDDGISIFPLSLKAGHRSSSDTFVFDYFFGLSYNMGAGNIKHSNDLYFDYNALKRMTYIFGMKVGIKI